MLYCALEVAFCDVKVSVLFLNVRGKKLLFICRHIVIFDNLGLLGRTPFWCVRMRFLRIASDFSRAHRWVLVLTAITVLIRRLVFKFLGLPLGSRHGLSAAFLVETRFGAAWFVIKAWEDAASCWASWRHLLPCNHALWHFWDWFCFGFFAIKNATRIYSLNARSDFTFHSVFCWLLLFSLLPLDFLFVLSHGFYLTSFLFAF